MIPTENKGRKGKFSENVQLGGDDGLSCGTSDHELDEPFKHIQPDYMKPC